MAGPEQPQGSGEERVGEGEERMNETSVAWPARWGWDGGGEGLIAGLSRKRLRVSLRLVADSTYSAHMLTPHPPTPHPPATCLHPFPNISRPAPTCLPRPPRPAFRWDAPFLPGSLLLFLANRLHFLTSHSGRSYYGLPEACGSSSLEGCLLVAKSLTQP